MIFSGSDGGGISDAPTAVVSDTEGHGQIIQPRRNVFLTPGINHVLQKEGEQKRRKKPNLINSFHSG